MSASLGSVVLAVAADTVSVMPLLVMPPLAAVMVALPAATPVTTPSATVAAAAFDDAQVKTTPLIAAPS